MKTTSNIPSFKIQVNTENGFKNEQKFKEIELTEFSDHEELNTYLKELFKNEKSPKFIFEVKDYPFLVKELNLITKESISDEIFEVIEAIENNNYDIEIIDSFLYNHDNYDNIDDIISIVQNRYIAYYGSDEDYAQNYVEENEDLEELPRYIHIDWEKTAKDLMYDTYEHNGYYFRTR